ncbi:MAG: hypothetical protein LUD46_00545 [Parabacteroides sp.]|nr:hypothetical protein [Parabacteroides sp.]
MDRNYGHQGFTASQITVTDIVAFSPLGDSEILTNLYMSVQECKITIYTTIKTFEEIAVNGSFIIVIVESQNSMPGIRSGR